MVVSVILHKLAVGEVHVAIREELTIERATFHVDSSGMLETMVVFISKVKRHVLERSTFGNISNVSTSSVVKLHTIHSSLYGNVLWKIWHCVRTSSSDADGSSCVCTTNSRSQLLLGRYAHCRLCGRHARHHYQQCQAEITDSLFHYY